MAFEENLHSSALTAPWLNARLFYPTPPDPAKRLGTWGSNQFQFRLFPQFLVLFDTTDNSWFRLPLIHMWPYIVGFTKKLWYSFLEHNLAVFNK
jgi:hypothetical protein